MGFVAIHLREREPAQARQVGQSEPFARGQRVARRQHADAALAQQRLIVETAGHRPEQSHRQIKPPGIQVIGPDRAMDGLEAGHQPGRLLVQPLHEGPGQQELAVRAQADIDHARGAGGIEGRGRTQRRVQAEQRAVHGGMQLQRPFGRHEPALDHDQQRVIQPAPQPGQLAADGRLRLVQLARGGGGAARAHQRIEGQQQIHIQPPQGGQGRAIAHGPCA